ncbi:MAG TPA: 30S ribosomal protein S12 methylthiotransferase RimO [Candidatus Polarisedimenticolaceae bacterium]|nr:30S ribosomal protein S12 methylthiotransferase RimO [Candidatus Polarisedimenticolaceae bacterium]
MSGTGKPRVGVVSLGCSKNLVDTEVMLGHLDAGGATFVTDPGEADVLLVNTCAFIGEAREESVRAILDAAELKRTGKLQRLVVAGCMVQRYREELRESLPEVDAFLGLDELHQVSTAVRSDLPLFTAKAPPAATYLYGAETPRRLSTPPWSAYVKIAEGCDHTCAFCAIPAFRGAFRSRTPDSVVAEAEALAGRGVREINLIAQDSSHYGRDRGDREGLPGLLRRLDAVSDLRWIRVHYLYPNTVTQELIDTMAVLPRVVDYVDVPLQHAHPDVLSRMRRGGSVESHLRLLARFRAAMPEGALRTTLIVGFPGESEAEFEALLSFVREARFDHLGVFAYSHEEGTGAHALADDVPDEVKQARRARLLEAQQDIVAERLARQVGSTAEVLVEGAHADTEHLLVGRLSTQAPDVDGSVLLNDGPALPPGSFARVELTDVAGYDLVGKILHAA